MKADLMADLAWELYEVYGPGTTAYCEGQAEDAAARGDTAMQTYYLNLARLAAEIRDPELPETQT